MDQRDWTSEDSRVARDILLYLLNRPTARDSIESITEWWLRRQRLDEAVCTVQRVMKRLVSDSLILEYERPSGYGLNTTRLEDVRRFVAISTS